MSSRSRNMAAIRRRDTNPELVIRRALHANGHRYRVDYPIRIPGHRLVRPDIAFTRARVAVFIDGCFWHGCPDHGQRPKIANAGYWAPKLKGNMERDSRHRELLESAGWTVLRFWEHESPDDVVDAIEHRLAASGG